MHKTHAVPADMAPATCCRSLVTPHSKPAALATREALLLQLAAIVQHQGLRPGWCFQLAPGGRLLVCLII